jgi:hypothetical protein
VVENPPSEKKGGAFVAPAKAWAAATRKASRAAAPTGSTCPERTSVR